MSLLAARNGGSYAQITGLSREHDYRPVHSHCAHVRRCDSVGSRQIELPVKDWQVENRLVTAIRPNILGNSSGSSGRREGG